MDLLTLSRLLRVVKAKKGIDVMGVVFGGMLGIDGEKGIVENRALGYV